MDNCPECNADRKYNYTDTLGGDVVGFYCGAIWVRSSSRTSYVRKGCDYRAPKEGTIIGVDLASDPDRTVCVDAETGLPVEVKLMSPEKLKELYRRHALE